MDKEKEKEFDKIIDRELLISSVEQRPVLWDKFLDIYKDKIAKTAAWREICLLLTENFETMEQKERQFFGKCVIKRWTQIRDAWVKSINAKKTSKKSGSATISAKPYRYHKELSFLKRVVDPCDTQDNISSKNKNQEEELASEECNAEGIEINLIEKEGQNEEYEAEKNQNNQKSALNQKGLIPPIRNRKRVSEVDEKMMTFIDHQLKQPQQKLEEDRNLSFFKSILPSLQVFDDDQTLEFQSQVINIIQTIKRRRYYSYNYCPQNSNYTYTSQNQYPGYDTRSEPEQSPSAASTSTQPESVQSPSAASTSTPAASTSAQGDIIPPSSAASPSTQNYDSEYSYIVQDLDLSSF